MPTQKTRSKKPSSPARPQPTVSRPKMPEGYLSKSKAGLLSWKWLDERMAKALNYWVATTRPDGRPHVMPVWGVWLDGTFYFGTHSGSRKARNLKTNPQMAVHLESGEEVAIVEGTVEETRDPALMGQIDTAYSAKYGMPASHGDDAPMYALRPRVAFGWELMRISKSATRWSFSR